MKLKEDGMTCAYDKTSFEEYKAEILKKGGETLYAVYVKVNDVKNIRGFYSLHTGDNCIILAAARLKKVTDKLFRIKDDVFVLFVYTDEELQRLEKIKILIPTLYIESGKSLLTVSVGISDKSCAADIEYLIKQAKEKAENKEV